MLSAHVMAEGGWQTYEVEQEAEGGVIVNRISPSTNLRFSQESEGVLSATSSYCGGGE